MGKVKGTSGDAVQANLQVLAQLRDAASQLASGAEKFTKLAGGNRRATPYTVLWFEQTQSTLGQALDGMHRLSLIQDDSGTPALRIGHEARDQAYQAYLLIGPKSTTERSIPELVINLDRAVQNGQRDAIDRYVATISERIADVSRRTTAAVDSAARDLA